MTHVYQIKETHELETHTAVRTMLFKNIEKAIGNYRYTMSIHIRMGGNIDTDLTISDLHLFAVGEDNKGKYYSIELTAKNIH